MKINENGTRFLRDGFNACPNTISVATGLHCTEPSLTQQQYAEEADINTLVYRYKLIGQLPDQPLPTDFGDFSSVTDYQSALETIQEMRASFMTFPANIRAKFDNDPANLVYYLNDPANHAEAVSLGLLPSDNLQTGNVTSSDTPVTPSSDK